MQRMALTNFIGCEDKIFHEWERDRAYSRRICGETDSHLLAWSVMPHAWKWTSHPGKPDKCCSGYAAIHQSADSKYTASGA